MAEETNISSAGPNGERLQIQLGSKSLGIASRDLILFVFVAGVFVVVYLNSQVNREAMGRLQTQQAQFIDTQHKALADLKELVHQAENVLKADLRHGQDEFRTMIQDQNQQLNQQTTVLQNHLDEQTEVLSQMITTHEWNEGREQGDRLPLTLPPAAVKKRIEKER